MTAPKAMQTPRLKLRQWRSADRDPFYALNSDPRVMAYFPALLSRKESDDLADRIEALIAGHGWGWWAVEELESGEFIGFVGLGRPAPDLPCYPDIEIGWRLAYRFWGRGYALEAAKASLKYGFETLGLAQIVSFTALNNLRSRALMERLGMTDTGRNFEHPRVAEESGLRQHCLYCLTGEQWRANK